jgi:DNA-binding transcriptional LysR family regulator
MQRGSFDDLQALVAVGRARSFTKAAAKLGVSQSALSQTVRQLEARLGVRLLTRTTRSVALTESGERIMRTVEPRFEEIEAALAAVRELREKPAGSIRITAGEHAIDTILWPKLSSLLKQYPDIKVEFVTDYGLTDIVAERYDAGVRWGEQVAKDMISLRIGPDACFAAVGSKEYFAKRPLPQKPQDLVSHSCINLRLPTYGGLYVWEFEKKGREVKVRVDGQLTFSGVPQMVAAARDGLGIAYVPADVVARDIAKGHLLHVLKEWSPPWTGYHLYYPSRRQPSAAFALLVEALRYRHSSRAK